MYPSELYWISGWSWVWTVPAVLSIAFICNAVYMLFLHPLRHIPGPKLFALSHLPYLRHHVRGTSHTLFERLHRKYGDVVRFAPDCVSFISMETAFQDIYGFRTGKHKGHDNMSKDVRWYVEAVNGVASLGVNSDRDHTRVRRSLAHAFSDSALKSQEAVLQECGNLLVDQLESVTQRSSEPVDLVMWYQWTTFDVIAALMFGHSFGCLRDIKTHRYVKTLVDSIPVSRMYLIKNIYSWVQYLPGVSFEGEAVKLRAEVFTWIKQQITKRMNMETDHPDFMTHLLAHDVIGKTISEDELHTNGVLLFAAGTDTTATLLAGATYLLCKNPIAYQKLKDEVRSLWSNAEEIDIRTSTHQAPYLNAVLSESFRVFSPVASGFPRMVPAGGETISGHFIPEGTSVSVTHDSAYRSERNFKDPEQFIPERWLGDAEWDGDKRRWMQPFSYGPRNCLGKNLAYAESRLFMAKMVWRFDFELDPRSSNWLENTGNMLVRSKPKLLVRISKASK